MDSLLPFLSIRACGPRKLMKISPSRMQNRAGWSGKIATTVEKLRLFSCLIRSVRG